MRVQCAHVNRVVCSVHKINLGGNVIVLYADKSNMQNMTTMMTTKIEYEDGQYIMYLWLPARKEEVATESDKVLKGNRFRILNAEHEMVFSRQVQELQVRKPLKDIWT